MHVFVSYSRRDTVFVRQIVERLESFGHDAWIDTDDIVGSERWRSSVAEAIATADVVLLMVSPASMQSKSVEREITVAAEEHRRILPVVIEAADVSIGLRYDLAGVHRVGFVDRAFDDAMAELLAAIDAAPADVPSRSVMLPSPAAPTRPVRRRRAGWKVGAWLVAIAGLAAFSMWRQNSDDPSAVATEPTDSARVTEVDDPAPPEGPTEAEFTTTVWFAGYTITATGARFDEDDLSVDIDVVFRNDQHATADPCALLLEDVALVVDGRRHMLWADHCTRLTPGTETRATLAATIGETVELGSSAIEFGSPEQHRAIIPLDGRPGTSDSPLATPVSATIDGEVSSFTVELVEVVPADCWGLSSSLGFAPGSNDEMSIVVTGSTTSRNPYPLGYGKARLTLPDGANLASNSLAGVIHVVDPGTTTSDIRACFIVPAPVEGEYWFTIASDGAEEFPAPIPLTL